MPSPSENSLKIQIKGALRSVKLKAYEAGSKPATASKRINPYQQGFADGQAAALAEYAKKAQQLELFLRNATIEFRKACENEFKALEPQIVELAMSIATSILHQEIDKSHYKIDSVIAQVLEPVRKTGQALELHVNPEDHKTLTQNASGTPWPGVQLIADASVGRACCRIKTPYGTILRDAQSLLQEIGKTLSNEAVGASS